MPAGYADAVVVAAGRSSRMGGLDKLRATLGGRPVLAWSVAAMAASPAVGHIVVVAPAGRVKELASAPWVRAVQARVVAGGPRRQESSAAGLAATRPSCEVVLVHDGARPFASSALVDAVAAAALAHGAAIPVRIVHDAVKRVVDGRVIGPEDRSTLGLAQTPQGARRDLLARAFAAAGGAEHADEASLLAAAGIEVAAVPGEADNLKVTTLEDLRRAEVMAARRIPGQAEEVRPLERRLARGHDSHPFGPGQGLAIGGLLIEAAPRLHGHSDGDVALHAIADAVLGGARLGDLGRLFPAGDPATRGVASKELLAEAVRLARAAGWRPASVDLLLEGARPTFGSAWLDAIRQALAEALSLHPEAVSVRASSGNLDGATGTGRSLAADALVTLVRLPGHLIEPSA